MYIFIIFWILSTIRFLKKVIGIIAKIEVKAGPRIVGDFKTKAKSGVQTKFTLLVSLFGIFKPVNLDYTDFRKVKFDIEPLGDFFL